MTFIEIEYTGKTEDGVFDTTSEETAKENKVFNPKATYGPIVVCLGQGHLVKGLDKALEGKTEGELHVDLKPEDAFGNRDAKLLQLIPAKKLTDNKIRPFPGLQIDVDGQIARIKTVSGGRVMADFNHPLAGKDISYDVKILREVTDDLEKAKALLTVELRIQPQIEKKGEDLVVSGIPEQIQEPIKKRLSELISSNIVFEDAKTS